MGVSSAGGYFITKVKDGGIKDLASGSNDNGAVRQEATNDTRGDCTGSELTLYVNGQKPQRASDLEFDVGKVGLFVNEANADENRGADVSFDNFSVIAP